MNLLVLDWSIKLVNLPDGEGFNLRNAFLKCFYILKGLKTSFYILKGTKNIILSDHSSKDGIDAIFTAILLKDLSD